MVGTLARALLGRNIPLAREDLHTTVEGRIVGTLNTIKIESIAVHYAFPVPPEYREVAERALRVHPVGCPAHESVKGAIAVTWDARVRVGDEVIALSSADSE